MAKVSAADLVDGDFLRVSASDPVSKTMNQFISTKNKNALVFDGKNFSGIVSWRSLYRGTKDFSKVSNSSVTEKAPALSPADPVERIAKLMLETGLRTLPVFDKNKLLGVVTHSSVLRSINSFGELRAMKAMDIATKDFISLPDSSTLSQAFSAMRKKGIDKIPLADRNGVLVGVVSFTDLMRNFLIHPPKKKGGVRSSMGYSMKAFKENETISGVLVKSRLSPETIVTASPEESLPAIVQKMSRANVSSVIIFDGRPRGIVTITNLLKAFDALKSGPGRNIQVSDCPAFDEIDAATFSSSLDALYDKAEMLLHNEIILFVHFKELSASGARHKYDVSVRLNSAGKLFIAKDSGWSALTSVRNALSSVEREIKKFVQQ
ncbi:MAG: CBS domain-containing protein [Candidatus Diapherotrites archaeon]|nr:CBS domain-containing protein [Candidatus Diapherotrites archaeon]